MNIKVNTDMYQKKTRKNKSINVIKQFLKHLFIKLN